MTDISKKTIASMGTRGGLSLNSCRLVPLCPQVEGQKTIRSRVIAANHRKRRCQNQMGIRVQAGDRKGLFDGQINNASKKDVL